MIETDRERLRTAVRDLPGQSTRELAEALGMSKRNALTDLSRLEREGLVERWWDGRSTRWFPP
jgi:DNA-binding Lrp family transcriptional regulator